MHDNQRLREVFHYLSEKLHLSVNNVTSEGAFYHTVLYYQPLLITRYQERFYEDNYFE